jgi:hypothetical protein
VEEAFSPPRSREYRTVNLSRWSQSKRSPIAAAFQQRASHRCAFVSGSRECLSDVTLLQGTGFADCDERFASRNVSSEDVRVSPTPRCGYARKSYIAFAPTKPRSCKRKSRICSALGSGGSRRKALTTIHVRSQAAIYPPSGLISTAWNVSPSTVCAAVTGCASGRSRNPRRAHHKRNFLRQQVAELSHLSKRRVRSARYCR